jgi:hypothetical protein
LPCTLLLANFCSRSLSQGVACSARLRTQDFLGCNISCSPFGFVVSILPAYFLRRSFGVSVLSDLYLVISPYGCPGNVPQQPAVSSSPPCRVCLCCPSRICFCPSSLHLVTMACAAVLVPHYLCVACLLCLSLSSLVCIIVPVFPSFGMRFCSLVSRSPVVVWCSFSFQNPCISVCGLRLRFCGHTPAHLRAVALSPSCCYVPSAVHVPALRAIRFLFRGCHVL